MIEDVVNVFHSIRFSGDENEQHHCFSRTFGSSKVVSVEVYHVKFHLWMGGGWVSTLK